MTGFSTNTLLVAVALSAITTTAMTTTAFAEAAKPTPWVLTPDMGYAYDKDGKTFSYKMGTKKAELLLKGAKKGRRGRRFLFGNNGQFYMRTGPFFEPDAKSM